ncbi:AraC family transcriptional regulator [Paenibacillus eucommiae]|uniref:AraC-like DNA-binding protein n=1 Tax=Paenibacillus eucommiae TaxID=1355755 RepID=A0ABS4J3Z4_9BACL|nr:AraC family transcriptional regulator [Paenibacillus eucommiae]MBP1994568.1 AraC-like DNA-binding protein [Paenibacillus eucommiae]
MSAHFKHVSINTSPGNGDLVILFAGHSQTSPEYRNGPKVIDNYLIHYVLSGKGNFNCLGRDYELNSGDLFFIFPEELFSYAPDLNDPWKYRWIGFRGSRATPLLGTLGVSPQRPVLSVGKNRRIEALFHQINNTLQQSLASSDLKSEALMKLLVSELMQEVDTTQCEEAVIEPENVTLVKQAIQWLKLQYSHPISIDRMAQNFGYNRTYMSTLFKKYTGISPVNFLMKIRMEQAQLLLQKPLTIKQIAASVGYDDPLYFSRQFKKICGLSPTEYREKHAMKKDYI